MQGRACLLYGYHDRYLFLVAQEAGYVFQARVHTVLLEELAHPSAFTRPFLEHIPGKGVGESGSLSLPVRTLAIGF